MVTSNQIKSANSKLATFSKQKKTNDNREKTAIRKAQIAQKAMYDAIIKKAETIIKEQQYLKDIKTKGIFPYIDNAEKYQYNSSIHNEIILRQKKIIADCKSEIVKIFK